jgi:hypothetical protein
LTAFKSALRGTSTAADRLSARSSFRFCGAAACRCNRARSNGARVQASSGSRCSATACARRFASPTSIRRRSQPCRRTIEENHLAKRVSVYQSNNLADIPPSEQWNLVVSNPPHFIGDFDEAWTLRAFDKDWNIHRRFFATIGKFLAPDGVIVLQENGRGSTVESFRDMIDKAGLTIVFVHGGKPELTFENNFYYIGIMRRGDTPPAWAAGPLA